MNSERSLGMSGLPLLIAGLFLAACGGPSTTFVSSWRSPKAEPVNMKGEPVAAVVMVHNEGTRRNAEDVLAREISYYGPQGIPMYTLMAGPAVGNEQAARAAVERAGVKGVVVMRPTGRTKKTETYTTYSDPYYAGYWGGYYGYGWAQPWGVPYGAPYAGPLYHGAYASTGSTQTHTSTTEVVGVEVLVYDLKQNMLIWAGQSESTEPSKVDEFVTQLAAATAKELGKQGLLINPK
jgi:hypothetical protein